MAISSSDVSGPCFIYLDKMLVNRLMLVEKENENEFETKISLDFFNEKGQFLRSYNMAEGQSLLTIDKEGHFYFVQREPYPKITRLMLELQ